MADERYDFQMGFLVGGFLQRRWLTLVGFSVLMVSLFLPWHSDLRLVVEGLAVALMLAQIPFSIRRQRQEAKSVPK
jgi:hypothetical protein